MHRISGIRILAGFLLACLLSLLLFDLFSAFKSQTCPSGPFCFPWGAEGPVAGSWSYESKTNYIVRGFAQFILIAGSGFFVILRAGQGHPIPVWQRAAALTSVAVALLLMFV
jgi:hypothetical protein